MKILTPEDVAFLRGIADQLDATAGEQGEHSPDAEKLREILDREGDEQSVGVAHLARENAELRSMLNHRHAAIRRQAGASGAVLRRLPPIDGVPALSGRRR